MPVVIKCVECGKIIENPNVDRKFCSRKCLSDSNNKKRALAYLTNPKVRKKLNDYWRGYHKCRYHNDPEFRENILKKNDDWKRKNPEKFRQGRKIWYLKNREKLLKYFKKHYHEKRKKKSNGGVGYKHLNK